MLGDSKRRFEAAASRDAIQTNTAITTREQPTAARSGSIEADLDRRSGLIGEQAIAEALQEPAGNVFEAPK